MNARRDLLAEYPQLTQIATPDTDASAYIPLHPGAAAFYNGTEESFLDKWGNIIFLVPMILGGLASVGAATWKFLREGEPVTRDKALDALYALGARIRASSNVAELSLDVVSSATLLLARIRRAERIERVQRLVAGDRLALAQKFPGRSAHRGKTAEDHRRRGR